MNLFKFSTFLIYFFLFSCSVEKERAEHNIADSGAPDETNFRYEYSGDSLKHIAMPVGGIGTGNALIGGRGNILEWEIFGKADRDELPPYMTFFALHIDSEDGKKINRVMEGRILNDYPNPFGVPRQQLAGIPRFEKCTFTGDFPFGRVMLSDEDLPVNASLKTWNPFIPLDTRASSYPLANFEWSFENTSDSRVDGSMAFNFGNPFVDYLEADKKIIGRVESVENDNFRGVKFILEKPFSAEFMVVTQAEDATISNRWLKGRWWDNAEVFWREFSEKGSLEPHTGNYVFKAQGLPDVSTISIPFKLDAGQKNSISFHVFWRIPHRNAERSMSLGTEMEAGKEYRNFYTVGYDDVEEIALDYYKNGHMLEKKTEDFNQLLYNSSLPAYIIDALASNLAAIKSNLIMRNEDGKVHAFEGLGNDFGCCPGNCTHVWNYAQTLAFLFPDLERDMRETNFLHDTHPSGAMSFRTVFPPGPYHMMSVAADGQMGTILRAYREWKYSGDTEWLRKLWPKISSALEYAWKQNEDDPKAIPWDPDREGVIRSRQHNTYDIDFYGPNMLTGSMYLGALKAAAEMASVLGETEKNKEYMEIFYSGRSIYEDILWNGEYYEQKVEVIRGLELPDHYRLTTGNGFDTIPKYQFAGGCLSDQLLGQFLADLTGLGSLLDSIRIETTLKSIYRHNFIPDFSDYENVQRVYALNEEAGLILCSWPNGDKPAVPFVYSDEVWTGVEYQLASSLIYRGMTDEGLEIAKAVRERYRGYNRNPFAEIESGRFYARSLASWALLTSISGFQYDGVEQSLHFIPRINQNRFFTFWSTGKAWGSFEISDKDVAIKVYHGELSLKEFGFNCNGAAGIDTISYNKAAIKSTGNQHILEFADILNMKEGEGLSLKMK